MPSEEIKDEIESNPELKEFSDDISKINSLMEDIGKQVLVPAENNVIIDKILNSQSEKERAEFKVESLFQEPLPETEEERATYLKTFQQDFQLGKSEEKSREEMKKEDGDLLKLSLIISKPGMASGDSSGKIDLGSLVAQHKKSVTQQSPLIPSLSIQEATLRGTSRTRNIGMFVLIVIFIAVGIAAVWKIVVISSLGKKSEQEAKYVESLKGIKTTKTNVITEKETIDTQKIVAEKTTATSEESTSHFPSAKSKKRKGGSDLASAEKSLATSEVAQKSDEASSSTSPAAMSTEEKSKKDLMSLLDSATTKKQKSTVSAGSVTSATEQQGKSASSIPNVDELLGEKASTEKKESDSKAGLPATLSKNEIREVMKKLNPQIMKCGEGKVGTLILNLVVNNDGTVSSAKASGQFANDPTGKCAENVAKTAKFPPFKNPTMNVTYPYVFAPPPGT
ncbi:MAG: hypothetical protein NC830_05415 [Candidatus Omnitrophica bacterium]|nr:hypothetical protein [Candidatus Omnitrophota bacterium]